MSNYNFVQPGITVLAQKKINKMTRGELKSEMSRLDKELYTSNVYLYPERVTQTKQHINYINSIIRKRNNNSKKYNVNYGGRRTRRNRSKRSTRRR